MCSKALPNPSESSAVRARRDDAFEDGLPAGPLQPRAEGEREVKANRPTALPTGREGRTWQGLPGLPGLAAMRRSCADLFEKLLSSHGARTWLQHMDLELVERCCRQLPPQSAAAAA